MGARLTTTTRSLRRRQMQARPRSAIASAQPSSLIAARRSRNTAKSEMEGPLPGPGRRNSSSPVLAPPPQTLRGILWRPSTATLPRHSSPASNSPLSMRGEIEMPRNARARRGYALSPRQWGNNTWRVATGDACSPRGGGGRAGAGAATTSPLCSAASRPPQGPGVRAYRCGDSALGSWEGVPPFFQSEAP